MFVMFIKKRSFFSWINFNVCCCLPSPVKKNDFCGLVSELRVKAIVSVFVSMIDRLVESSSMQENWFPRASSNLCAFSQEGLDKYRLDTSKISLISCRGREIMRLS